MKKILIVEDEPLQAEAFQKTLGKKYEVHVATDGFSGMDQALKLSPNLIILDIILPGGMTGIDVLRQLKTNPLTQSIPTIILTNLDNHERKVAADLGVTEYLLKTDVGMKQLEEKVDYYLKEH